MSPSRRAIVTAFVVAIAAGCVPDAHAADPPFERHRGAIPPADDGIVATLLRIGVPSTEPVFTVGGSVALDCVNETRADGVRLSPALAAHFGWYYQDCVTGARGERCQVQTDVFFLRSVALGPNLVGFLFRVPGMFTSSVVDLWTYDTARRRWLTPVELVDNWGDPDQWYLARSWLVDLDGDGYREVVKREKIGAGGRPEADRVTLRAGGSDGFAAPRAEPSLATRFDFTLACR